MSRNRSSMAASLRYASRAGPSAPSSPAPVLVAVDANRMRRLLELPGLRANPFPRARNRSSVCSKVNAPCARAKRRNSRTRRTRWGRSFWPDSSFSIRNRSYPSNTACNRSPPAPITDLPGYTPMNITPQLPRYVNGALVARLPRRENRARTACCGPLDGLGSWFLGWPFLERVIGVE